MGIFDVDDWGTFGAGLANKFIPKPDVQNFMKGLPIAAQGMVDSVKSGATYPGDVYSGKEPAPIPSQNPDLSRAADLAGLMPTGGALSAATGQIPKNAIGTFGGPFSKTAPIKDFMAGAKMERKGATPQDIWQEKGVFRDPEKNWSYEIPDRDAQLHSGINFKRPSHNELSQTLFHPKLYEAYPDLANITTSLYPKTKDVSGRFGTLAPGALGRMAQIEAKGPPRSMRSTLLHEINHAIDTKENRFGAGRTKTNYGKDFQGYIDYLRDPTEVMARAAQNRRNYTPDQAREIHPMLTPETPYYKKFLDFAAQQDAEAAAAAATTKRGPSRGMLAPREKAWF